MHPWLTLFWMMVLEMADVKWDDSRTFGVRSKMDMEMKLILIHQWDEGLRFGIDVGLIRELVSRNLVLTTKLPVADLLWSLTNWEQYGGDGTFGHVDMSPGITVIPRENEAFLDHRPLVVDGFTLLQKALKQGQTEVEVYVLSPQQVVACYVPDEDLPDDLQGVSQ